MYTTSKSKKNRSLINNRGSEDGESEGEVVSQFNDIYFYCGVTMKSALDFNTKFAKLVKKTLHMSVENECEPTPIKVHINSYGGEVASAISIVDTIRRSPVPVWTYIEGESVSAATLISCSGHRRFITKNSLMLIHQIRTGFWGKADEFEEEVKNNQKFMKIITELYKEKSTISDSDLETMLKKDSYMRAKKCLKLGLVDEII
jgi:ATP-dependent protease ClpP protease subunit